MTAIAPNLTLMVGELVGARLIAHAGMYVHVLGNELLVILTSPTFIILIIIGSLINLAKHPSSTVQILGAEKALFRFTSVYCLYIICKLYVLQGS